MRKIVFLFLFVFCRSFCSGQVDPWWHTTSALGGQLGYSYAKTNTIELGVNYQWIKYRSTGDITSSSACHTFGLFANATGIFAKNNFYIGQQVGINYHYNLLYCPRINIVYENNFNKDMRIGANIGLSFLGLYLYGGYYHPVGSTEETSISRYRIGLRFIFNPASFSEAPDYS